MDISFILQTLRSNRIALTRILDETPVDILAEIPAGFRNNNWWNIAHILVVQQLIHYKLSGLPVYIDKELVKGYSKGSAPGGPPHKDTLMSVRESLTETVKWLERDYKAGRFVTYTPYTTSARVTLNSIEDALLFNLYHEGLHMGVIRSLQKVTGHR